MMSMYCSAETKHTEKKIYNKCIFKQRKGKYLNDMWIY